MLVKIMLSFRVSLLDLTGGSRLSKNDAKVSEFLASYLC